MYPVSKCAKNIFNPYVLFSASLFLSSWANRCCENTLDVMYRRFVWMEADVLIFHPNKRVKPLLITVWAVWSVNSQLVLRTWFCAVFVIKMYLAHVLHNQMTTEIVLIEIYDLCWTKLQRNFMLNWRIFGYTAKCRCFGGIGVLWRELLNQCIMHNCKSRVSK